jgi:hypothetical protein
MRRILLFFVPILVSVLISTPAASAFGWKDVLQMHRDGIADSLIVQKIEYSGKTFHLDADDMRALKEAGVSDEVVSAMLRTEAEDGSDDSYHDYGYGYYGHPYYYPHSRLYLGFGLGYYDPHRWYYGGYWYPRYRTYYPPRYYWIHRYGRSYGNPVYAPYRGYTGHRGWTGNYGDTRYRTQVGNRTFTGNRGTTGYRTGTGTSRTGGAGGRTRSR